MWKKSDSLITHHLNRHGLAGAYTAGLVCQEAERLYPGLFRAVSVKDMVLTLETTPENQIPIKMIEGKLLADLERFATPQQLPIPRRVRLTLLRE